MRPRKILTVAALGLCLTAQAGIYSYSSGSINVGATIPDGNPAGWSTKLNVGSIPAWATSISDVSVKLDISGGYNGDLYAYLSYGGRLVPLLNRVGVGTGSTRTPFGYSDAGMNITLTDAGANNIHFYPEVGGYSITGGATWKPDGRAISPLAAPGDADADGTVTFASFNNLSPNGTWTLFFADLSSGAQSTLVSWQLDITAVPEPVNVALGILAGLFLVVTLVRSKHVRKRIHQQKAESRHGGRAESRKQKWGDYGLRTTDHGRSREEVRECSSARFPPGRPRRGPPRPSFAALGTRAGPPLVPGWG